MTLEQASFLSQVISAVAILASLVFLAMQIRGNTRTMCSQSYFNGMTHGQRPFEMMVQDAAVAKIVNTGYVSPDSLNNDERERFNLHTFMLFNSWEYFYYQHQDGAIPKQLFSGTDAHMRVLVETKPGLRSFWNEYRHAYQDPFLSYVSKLFDDLPSPVPGGSPT